MVAAGQPSVVSPAAVIAPAPSPPSPQPPPPPPQAQPAPPQAEPAPTSVPPPPAVPVAAAAPAPPPPTSSSSSSAAPRPARQRPVSAVVPSREETIEERPIRVGKIQWPPPRVSDDKLTVQVGRLDIEESEEQSNQPSADVTAQQRVRQSVVADQQNQHSSRNTQPV